MSLGLRSEHCRAIALKVVLYSHWNLQSAGGDPAIGRSPPIVDSAIRRRRGVGPAYPTLPVWSCTNTAICPKESVDKSTEGTRRLLEAIDATSVESEPGTRIGSRAMEMLIAETANRGNKGPKSIRIVKLRSARALGREKISSRREIDNCLPRTNNHSCANCLD